MLSFAIMGLAAIVSPSFAQENQSASQDGQRVPDAQRMREKLRRAQELQRRAFLCDSLLPEVCFDIYRRRMEQPPEHIDEQPWVGSVLGSADRFGDSDGGNLSLPRILRPLLPRQ